MMHKKIPTSNLSVFKQQVSKPNIGRLSNRDVPTNIQIPKDIVISLVSDFTGCGHIRNILPSMYMNAVFGISGVKIITTPTPIFDPDILARTRAVVLQRVMGTYSIPIVSKYKSLQNIYNFKLIYDIDDFIWNGDDEGEEIPEYNFGSKGITKEVRDSSVYCMKEMDTVTVSTQFLKDYIETLGVNGDIIQVVHNSLPGFLWGNYRKPKISERIEKPRVLWSASPTHWHNENKLRGDMENAWVDWVIKSVKEDKIEYIQMGGLPWFFEEIKDKITVIEWVNSLHYPSTLRSIRADFGISPLVPNYFNYSKSSIKYQEYCMVGAVGIGTVFDNGMPSPYDINIVKTSDNITVEDIDKLFDELVHPDKYNAVIGAQYEQLDSNGWLTESAEYINMMTGIL